nr:hypothetical protein [uncultured Methanolobus sp.]
MEKEFDYLRILKVDSATYFYLCVMLAPWFAYPFVFLPDEKIPDIYWIMGIVSISLVGFILLVRRLLYLKNLCFQSLDVIGRIATTHGRERGGSLVEFTYDYQGGSHLAVNQLRTSQFYRYGFLEGDEIAVRLNPKKPRDAVMRDVYYSIDENRTSFVAPKVNDSIPQKKVIDRDLHLLSNEIVFADVWASGRIDTNLSISQFTDAIMKFGHEAYNVNKKGNKVLIRKNLSVQINTAKLLNKDIITLEFRRYYNRFYVLYFAFAFIIGFVITDYMPGHRLGHLTFLLLLFPLVLLQAFYESDIGINTFKIPNYPRIIQNVYSEILDAVREKEKEIA